MSRGRSRRRSRGRRMGVARVCECTRTRARLTQSEKCCMATVHKGTRLCRRVCRVCLYACVCVLCVSVTKADLGQAAQLHLAQSREAHVQAVGAARRYWDSGDSHSGAQVVNTINKIRPISRETLPHARTHARTLGGIRLSSRRTVDSPCGSKR